MAARKDLEQYRSATRTCEACGQTFGRSDKPGVIYNAFMRLRFCCRECSRTGARNDHKAYFLRHIDKSNEGCWLWTGGIMNKGYGIIHVDGQKQYAHRYSYELHKGPCGELHVLHSCDTPRCVNPEHLRLGTHKDNMEDARLRGRFLARSKLPHPTAKLTAEQVSEIKASGEAGVALARRLGVSKSTIYAIRRGQNWRGVNDAASKN